jgi:Protein tyrosine and serine/threonine kinase/Leucine rich repeat
METIDLLRSGQLAGSRRLKLAGGLTQLPPEVLDLADSLEILDLSNNHLKSLPEDFARLQRLKIAFFTNNDFEDIPAVLSQCPHLSMVSFKSNHLGGVGDRALPPSIRWLILTDNHIEQLPDSLGSMSQLQKLMLAGNQLRLLPETLASCQNLELIRISANQFQSLPRWLFSLPRLAWLAFAGNPLGSIAPASQQPLPDIDWADLSVGETLGQGASGVITQGRWQTPLGSEDVAVKLFKGDITSDGFPGDEMAACLAAGAHENLVCVRGRLINTPESQSGLVLSLIPPTYKNLGQPPDFDTCTRDTYSPNTRFELPLILQVAQGIAAAAAHLHGQGILHGDLYAHNILVNPVGHSLLGDFGAASVYDPRDETIAPYLERLEVRAFGYLLEDLLTHCFSANPVTIAALHALQQACLHPVLAQRPRFAEIGDRLRAIQTLGNS